MSSARGSARRGPRRDAEAFNATPLARSRGAQIRNTGCAAPETVVRGRLFASCGSRLTGTVKIMERQSTVVEPAAGPRGLSLSRPAESVRGTPPRRRSTDPAAKEGRPCSTPRYALGSGTRVQREPGGSAASSIRTGTGADVPAGARPAASTTGAAGTSRLHVAGIDTSLAPPAANRIGFRVRWRPTGRGSGSGRAFRMAAAQGESS